MIIHDDFVFVHLTKTGGTFISRFLEDHVPGSRFIKYEKFGKHAPAHLLSSVDRSKFKFSIVRNPFDFYISLWSANVIHGIKNNRPNRKRWFSNPEVRDNPNRFVEFLLLEEEENINHFRFDLMHRLNIGVLTYRYLDMFYKPTVFDDPNWLVNHEKYKLINKIIHQENLNYELKKLFETHIFKLSDKQINALNNYGKRNESKHKHYSEYYTQQTYDLIRQKDGFIFNLHYGEKEEI